MPDSLKGRLERLATATRQARDNATRGAGYSREISRSELVLEFERLAAMYDALLASVEGQLADLADEAPAADTTAPPG